MELVQVGHIVGPHGLGGHVRVVPVDCTPATLEAVAVWIVGFDIGSVIARRVEEYRQHVTARGISLIVLFDGLSDRTGAELLKGAAVFLRREDVSEADLRKDEATLWTEFEVRDSAGDLLGHVVERVAMPAHDLVVVSRPGRPDVLVPCVPEIVAAVDNDARVVVVTPPEGLFD